MPALAVACDIDPITVRQMALPPRPVQPNTRREYMLVGLWWWLEAKRGYPSSEMSLQYARRMAAKASRCSR